MEQIEEQSRPRRIAARKVLTYNINYHQVGYYAEREFQKALKFSLLEAEAAQAKQLEQSSKRRSQEKKENSLTTPISESPSRLNANRTSDCVKVINGTGSSIGSNRKCEVSNQLNRKLLFEANPVDLAGILKRSPINRSTDDVSSIVGHDSSVDNNAHTRFHNSNCDSTCRSMEKSSKYSLSTDSSPAPKLNGKRFFKNGLPNINGPSSMKSPLIDKSPRFGRPMRRAKANVSLYDFHIEFDDEDSPIKPAFRPISRHQTRKKIFAFQTCVKNEIRKKLLQKSIKYSAKGKSRTTRSTGSRSNAPHQRTAAAQRLNHRNRKLLNQVHIRQSRIQQTTNRKANSKLKTSKNACEKDEVLRKSRILIRNLHKLGQHIRFKRHEMMAAEAEASMTSPVRTVFQSMAADLRSLLYDSNDSDSELDTNFLDPLTVSGLMTHGFTTFDFDRLLVTIERDMPSEPISEDRQVNQDVKLPDPVLAAARFDLDEGLYSLDAEQQRDLKNQLYAYLDTIESQSISGRLMPNKRTDDDEEDHFCTAQSSPALVNI